MTGAPERIWAKSGCYHTYEQDWSEGEWDPTDNRGTPYVRKDVSDAMVAAAYIDAQNCMDRVDTEEDGLGVVWGDFSELATVLSNRAPADAKAAYDAAIEQARAEGMRVGMERAAGIAEAERDKCNAYRRNHDTGRVEAQRLIAGALQANFIAAAIRAAMEGE